jgi:hypothetical protein
MGPTGALPNLVDMKKVQEFIVSTVLTLKIEINQSIAVTDLGAHTSRERMNISIQTSNASYPAPKA